MYVVIMNELWNVLATFKAFLHQSLVPRKSAISASLGIVNQRYRKQKKRNVVHCGPRPEVYATDNIIEKTSSTIPLREHRQTK